MNLGRIVFGTIAVAVGAVLLLDALGLADSNRVFEDWWPLILVFTGAVAYLSNPKKWLVPGVLVVGGASILLQTTGVVDSLDLIGPALVIVIGIGIIVGAGGSRHAAATLQDRVASFNAFSGSEIASHSPQFEGGNVSTLFGGTELDLRDASLAPGAALDVFAAFGGVELKVPQGWNVVTHGLPIFGGFENVTAGEIVGPDAPVLDVNATVLFGGLEVKH